MAPPRQQLGPIKLFGVPLTPSCPPAKFTVDGCAGTGSSTLAHRSSGQCPPSAAVGAELHFGLPSEGKTPRALSQSNSKQSSLGSPARSFSPATPKRKLEGTGVQDLAEDESKPETKRSKASPERAFRGKGPWTEEEDQELMAFVQQHGPKNWRNAPRLTRLRRDAQSCRLRWNSHLCPEVNTTPFTAEEDNLLLETVSWGAETKWSSIASEKFPTRTGYQIQRRWHVLFKQQRKQQFCSAVPGVDTGKTLTSPLPSVTIRASAVPTLSPIEFELERVQSLTNTALGKHKEVVRVSPTQIVDLTLKL